MLLCQQSSNKAPAKLHIVKAMVFPVVMCSCERWTVSAEHRIIDAFELWCCWRLLRVPWTARRSNQLFLKEINPAYPLKGLMLKLKLQYFGVSPNGNSHLIGKVLDAGKDWRQKRATEDEMIGWHQMVQWTWIWENSGKWDREAWLAAVHGVTKSWTRLSD